MDSKKLAVLSKYCTMSEEQLRSNTSQEQKNIVITTIIVTIMMLIIKENQFKTLLQKDGPTRLP